MATVTYNAEADAVYIGFAPGKVERTKETGPFLYDLDAMGQIVGVEIRSATKVLAPGDWKKARRQIGNPRQRPQTAERHRGFIFIKRSSPRDVEPR
jgi:uncharacterized protein YuzE